MLDMFITIIMGIVEFFVIEIKEFLGLPLMFEPTPTNIFNALGAALENLFSSFFA